jgi:hypothetical protein
MQALDGRRWVQGLPAENNEGPGGCPLALGVVSYFRR